MHTCCIVEVYGGYSYGDATINSYYKYNINFRTNNVSDFAMIHKDVKERLKVGYRYWGTDNTILSLIVQVISNSNYTISVKGSSNMSYRQTEEVPSGITWL